MTLCHDDGMLLCIDITIYVYTYIVIYLRFYVLMFLWLYLRIILIPAFNPSFFMDSSIRSSSRLFTCKVMAAQTDTKDRAKPLLG